MIEILQEFKGDFFILDDGATEYAINEISALIRKYYRRVEIISLKEHAKKIFENQSELFSSEVMTIALGAGGKNIVSLLSRDFTFPQLCCCTWSRVWGTEYRTQFQHNLDSIDLCGKQIVIIEDVIASGETLRAVKNYLLERGASIIKVFAAVISGASPMISNQFALNICVGAKLNACGLALKDDEFSAHWYPAIYSLRHLLYGEDENPDFYNTISNLYFDGADIKSDIMKVRGLNELYYFSEPSKGKQRG